MPEYFDIVDRNDHVVGKDLRSNVHRYSKMHRAVHVMIFNKENEYFLQRRSASKDVSPLCWGSSVSGHLDSGEDYDEAALRETFEEVGAEPINLNFILKTSAKEETGQEFVKVYDFQHDSSLCLNADEICEGCWKQVEDINAWIKSDPEMFSRSFRYIWSKYRICKESS